MVQDKISILFVTTEYPGINKSGGAGIFVKNLFEGLVQAGHDPYVLIFSDDEPNDSQNINSQIYINYIKRGKGWVGVIKYKYRQLKAVYRLAKSLGVDLVEISTSGTDSFFLFPLAGIKVIARTHGSSLFVLSTYGRSRFVLNVNTVFQLIHETILCVFSESVAAVSSQYYKFFRSKFGNKVAKVENFVGRHYSNINVSASEFKFPYIFYHGTVKQLKGCTELVNQFLSSESSQHYKLVLAGKAEEEYLENLLSNANGKVLYMGECSEERIKRFLYNSSLCVYPSYLDAFNLAVAEALSQKALVLVSDVIDSSLVEHNKTGIRFSINEIDALGDEIDRVLSLSKVKSDKIRITGYLHCMKNYTYETGITRNIDYYNSILKNKRK